MASEIKCTHQNILFKNVNLVRELIILYDTKVENGSQNLFLIVTSPTI